MPFRINPAFDRYPIEAQYVGKLLAGFAEIEFSVCRSAGYAAGMERDVLKALYRLRATSSRIAAADALGKPGFREADLLTEYATALGMVGICLRIRNQFAHCNWADHLETPGSGLFFTDLQESASADEGFDQAWYHVDVPLLTEHETYFATTMEWLWFLYINLRLARGDAQGDAWPKPPALAQPLFHNPPEKHTPPWLSEDQKALHIARAQAARGGAPTPTPKQQALDKARAGKRAREQADRDRAKRSNPGS